MLAKNIETKIVQVSKDAYDLNDPNKLVEFFLDHSCEEIQQLFSQTNPRYGLEGDIPKIQYIAFLMLYYYYNYHSDKIIWEDADGNVTDIEMNVGFVSMKNYWANIAFYGLDPIAVMV